MNFFKTLLLSLSLFLVACVTTIKPEEVSDFRATAVMVTNAEESSGGTGVIYRSGFKGTFVLTNRHVCQLLKEGGYVINDAKYPVKAYKASQVHDICYVWVDSNLGVDTVLAPKAPELYSKAYVSGHPSLYPHVLSEGYISETMKIDIVIDTRDCTKEEFAENPFQCIFEGFPIVEELEASLVSALIAPGSSGSAVFNDKGEIIGLAFASNSRSLAYALVVPWEYVNNFVDAESSLLRWSYPKVAPPAAKSKKVKERATVLPFRELDDSALHNVENWKRFIECITQNQCEIK